MNGFFSRLIWGLLLVSCGAAFLLHQLGYITFDFGYMISIFWPVILILIGLDGLIKRRGTDDWWGIILIVLGFLFLGRNLDLIYWSFGDIIRFALPVVLIVIGLKMILKPNRRKQAHTDDEWQPFMPYNRDVPPPPPLHPDPTKEGFGPDNDAGGHTGTTGSGSSSAGGWHSDPHAGGYNGRRGRERHRGSRCDGRVEWWNSDPNAQTRSGFIGDIHLGEDYWELRPMNISHFIGDTVLDLTKAQIPLGETKLTVSSFIGDVKVFVPHDFDVGVHVISSSFIGDVSVLGRREGGMFRHVNLESPAYSEQDKKIRLVVSTFIGDVRVTKVG
jgi:lia operon protein LiaF